MPAPLTPDDFKNLIPNPNGGACDELRKGLLQVPQALWEQMSYMFNSDGTVSEAFATDMCTALGLINCAGGGGTSSSSTSSGSSTSSTTPIAPAPVYAVCGPPDGVGDSPNRFIEVNLATGAVSVIKTGTSYFYGLAEDPTTGILYGFVLNGANIDFVTVDKVTGNETVLGASIVFNAGPVGLTFNGSGVLYVTDQGIPAGSSANNGILKTVNKTNGALTTVGSYSSFFLNDICFAAGGALFGVGQQNTFSDMSLLSVNTTTGAVTNVINLNPALSATLREGALAYVNSILYFVLVNTIYQINTSTGAILAVSTFDNATQGRIRGMAKLQ